MRLPTLRKLPEERKNIGRRKSPGCCIRPGKAAVPESRLNVEAVLVNSSADSEDLLESSFAQRELVVRNWRPGERFWPAHTKELKKIKELLQDRHITGEEKRGWPVIASGD